MVRAFAILTGGDVSTDDGFAMEALRFKPGTLLATVSKSSGVVARARAPPIRN